jgi:hypothetical protein
MTLAKIAKEGSEDWNLRTPNFKIPTFSSAVLAILARDIPVSYFRRRKLRVGLPLRCGAA